MKRMLKKLVVLIVATVVMSAVSVPVFAGQNTVSAPATTASTTSVKGNPYTDVTKKYVGADAYRAIKYIKAHHGYDKVITGKKFNPYKKITRREFLLILMNLYGAKYVPVSRTDLQKANSGITARWACNKMCAVAEKLGCKIKWDGDSQKLTRAGASQYIEILCKFRPALAPKN